jgi:DNA-binding NarL/FixJ family response regulator
MEEIKNNAILEAFKTICVKSDNKQILREMYRNIIYESDKVFYNKLQKLYPRLPDAKWEFETVFLMCFGFDNYEIAFLLCLEKNTVEHIQSSIRKNFGIGARANIASFFLDSVKEK